MPLNFPPTEDRQYQLIGTPSGHLWQQVSNRDSKGVIERKCVYCGVEIKEIRVQGITTYWDRLITFNVPKCSHSYKTAEDCKS